MDLIYNELPTVFPWYDKLEKQRRFTENAAENCDYKLISPNDRFLSFQFLTTTGAARPVKWELLTTGGNLAIDLTENLPLLKGVESEAGLHIFYTGEVMSFTRETIVENLLIPESQYYSVLTFDDDTEIYSEVFSPKEDLSNFVKIEFWNSCDIKPIMYSAINWKQVLYLDTFIHTGEPEINEEGERDGEDNLIPTFQKMTVSYKISALVPDFIKIAVTSMQIHDEVYLTTAIRTGKIERIITTSTVEPGGAYSTIDVSLQQLIMSRDACCENFNVSNADPWAL